MKSLVLSLAGLVIAMPLVAAAQAPPTTGDLQIERKQKKAVVLPKPSPEQVRSDADRAVSDYVEGRAWTDTARETSPVQPPTRPDLSRDVTGGIQQQQINKELFKR